MHSFGLGFRFHLNDHGQMTDSEGLDHTTAGHWSWKIRKSQAWVLRKNATGPSVS